MNELEKIKEQTFIISADELIKSIVKKDDFVVINNKIEPTRDLMLKLSTVTKTKTINTELVNVTIKDKDTIYIFKATVELGQKSASAHGACSTSEIATKGKNTRIEHDAMATAETRALKRAFEEAVGIPFINEIILKLFGGYETPSGEFKETPQITAKEFIEKINQAEALPHLKNIWIKYQANLKTYTKEEQEQVIAAKEKKKMELKGGIR